MNSQWTEQDMSNQRDRVLRGELFVHRCHEDCLRAPWNIPYSQALEDAKKKLRSEKRVLEQMSKEIGQPIQKPLF